jgi:uncharacterized protein
MDPTPYIEEQVSFSSGDNTLSGILSYPEQDTPLAAVLLCSPHPHFAGDMDNNIIQAIAQGLGQTALCLRFNYRGIGASSIHLPPDLGLFDYWSQVEDQRDYADAVQDVGAAAHYLMQTGTQGLDLFVVGYSFGTVTGGLFASTCRDVRALLAIAPPLGRVSFDFMNSISTPSHWLIGQNDFLYTRALHQELAACLAPIGQLEVWDQADHFYRGEEARVANWVQQHIPTAIKVNRRETL